MGANTIGYTEAHGDKLLYALSLLQNPEHGMIIAELNWEGA